MTEPLTSLIQRELTILSKNFGQLGRTSWELSRLLLRVRNEYAIDGNYEGESGAVSAASQTLPDAETVPDEPLWLQEDLLS